MIKWIKVRNPYNEELTVTLTEAEPTHGLIVKEVTGLGSKASLSFTDYVILDGSINTNARVEKRTIGINFLLTFAPDIESSRRNVYRYFPIKGKIRLWIGTDYRVSYIDGIVESIEPGIFAEQEEVNVSIVCEDPFFRSDTPVLNLNLDENFGSVGKSFEFPFENNSLTEKLIEFGDVARDSAFIDEGSYYSKYYCVSYEGDVPTGAVFTLTWDDVTNVVSIINAHSSMTNLFIGIKNALNQQEMFINLTKLLKNYAYNNYVLTISSVKGHKYINQEDDTTYLGAFEISSDWLELGQGDNNLLMRFFEANPNNFKGRTWKTMSSAADFPITTVNYTNLYQGV